MPDIDATSRYYHLIQLVQEYREIIDQVEHGGLETEEIRYLQGQRSVTHDQIIEEFVRLKIPFVDREDVMRQAFRIAQWARPAEDDDEV
jgi:hypothetical protein